MEEKKTEKTEKKQSNGQEGAGGKWFSKQREKGERKSHEIKLGARKLVHEDTGHLMGDFYQLKQIRGREKRQPHLTSELVRTGVKQEGGEEKQHFATKQFV